MSPARRRREAQPEAAAGYDSRDRPDIIRTSIPTIPSNDTHLDSRQDPSSVTSSIRWVNQGRRTGDGGRVGTLADNASVKNASNNFTINSSNSNTTNNTNSNIDNVGSTTLHYHDSDPTSIGMMLYGGNRGDNTTNAINTPNSTQLMNTPHDRYNESRLTDINTSLLLSSNLLSQAQQQGSGASYEAMLRYLQHQQSHNLYNHPPTPHFGMGGLNGANGTNHHFMGTNPSTDVGAGIMGNVLSHTPHQTHQTAPTIPSSSSSSPNPFSRHSPLHQLNQNRWKLCRKCNSSAFISDRELLDHEYICQGGGTGTSNKVSSAASSIQQIQQQLESDSKNKNTNMESNLLDSATTCRVASSSTVGDQHISIAALRDMIEARTGRGSSNHHFGNTDNYSSSTSTIAPGFDFMLNRANINNGNTEQGTNIFTSPMADHTPQSMKRPFDNINSASQQSHLLNTGDLTYTSRIEQAAADSAPLLVKRRRLTESSPEEKARDSNINNINNNKNNNNPANASTSVAAIPTTSSASIDNSAFKQSTSLPLATPTDKDWLIPLHCFVRLYCVEFFTATEGDVSKWCKRRHVNVGQVGIRCAYCQLASEKAGSSFKWERGSICYPRNIVSIYNATMNLIQRHVSECNHLPGYVRERYNDLRVDDARCGSSKKYWIDSAKSLGLVDTIDGIRISKEVPPTIPMSNPHHQQQQQQQDQTANSNSQDNFDGTLFSSVSNSLKGVSNNQQSSSIGPGETRAGQPKEGDSGQSSQQGTNRDSFEPLVAPEDKSVATDFSYLLLEQMRPCGFTEADRLGKRKGLPLGYTGMSCIHCYGGYGSGRYFPSNVKTMADTSKTLDVIYSHMMKCLKCPEDIRVKLELLREKHDEDRARKKFGSQKAFFLKIWGRLHGKSNSDDKTISTTSTSSTS